MKKKTITALIWQEDNWYVARSLEVEVASQGKTRNEAIKNLTEALELYFEDGSNSTSALKIKEPTLETVQVSYA